MRDSTSLGPWVRRFLLEHLVAERNLALNTQRSYRDMLTLLLPFLAKKHKKSVDRLSVVDLSPKLARLFLGHLEQQRQCEVSTRNQRLGALHALARFIGEHSPEHVDWCAQIRLIPYKKTSQPGITCLDKAEMDALLAAPNRETPQGRRDYALLLFLYNSGARASEAAQLLVRDVDVQGLSVRITGKGRKQRLCPLWPTTVDQLMQLIEGRAVHDHVFLNRCSQPITRFGIHSLVERSASRACTQIPSLERKRVSPHTIRHSTATALLRSGVDINTIRGWLGHVSINTTTIYAEIDLETKARALATCAPADGGQSSKPWRERPGLMEFLRGL